MRRSFFLLIFSLIFCLNFSATGISGDQTGAEAGKYAPLFETKDINGEKITLSELKGKVVIINFWATWCSPCQTDMVSLNKLYTTLKDKDFIILAISLDRNESAVKSFVSEKGITFPILMDKDRKIGSKYSIIGLPIAFLVDKKGVIVEKFMGEVEWDSPEIRNKILKLLYEKTESRQATGQVS